VRPFQLNPPRQFLNMPDRVSPFRKLT
jgi:hypothetical protein